MQKSRANDHQQHRSSAKTSTVSAANKDGKIPTCKSIQQMIRMQKDKRVSIAEWGVIVMSGVGGGSK
jgi:hypothetical protein